MSATARKEELKAKLAEYEARTRPFEEELARIEAEEEAMAKQKKEDRITQLDKEIAALMAERDALRPLSVYIRKVKGVGWKSRVKYDRFRGAEYNKRAILGDAAADAEYAAHTHYTDGIKRILFESPKDEFESDPFC